MMLRLWLLSSLLLLTTGCRGRAPASAGQEATAVCSLKLPKHLQHTNPDSLPAAMWHELMFKGYRDRLGHDPVDCSGEPITWPLLPESCIEQEPASRVRERHEKLTPSQLIVRHASGDYWFGWAPYLVFENGMSEGPITIARLHEGKLEARAIGSLRSYTGKARLEVRRLGNEHILVAEGEYCPAPEACSRATRLMWLDRQRFRLRPLRSATIRSCLGPAWFPHLETIERQVQEHWTRVLQRTTALSYGPEEITLQERIVVLDRDMERPTLPPRTFRDAQAEMRLFIQDGEFMSEGQSLWKAIKIEDGSTELSDASSR